MSWGQPQGPAFHGSPPATGSSRVDQVPLLGTLMAAHGGLMLAWSLFCVFGASVGALSHLTGGDEIESTLMLVGYTIFALGSLPVGVLQLVAGLRLRQFKNRKLALVSQWLGLVAFFLGAVFCFPTALALVIFGHVVLLDQAVADRFGDRAPHLS